MLSTWRPSLSRWRRRIVRHYVATSAPTVGQRLRTILLKARFTKMHVPQAKPCRKTIQEQEADFIRKAGGETLRSLKISPLTQDALTNLFGDLMLDTHRWQEGKHIRQVCSIFRPLHHCPRDRNVDEFVQLLLCHSERLHKLDTTDYLTFCKVFHGGQW